MAAIALLLPTLPGSAQDPVPAGKGSYASTPPAGQGKIDGSTLNIVKADERGVPPRVGKEHERAVADRALHDGRLRAAAHGSRSTARGAGLCSEHAVSDGGREP